MTPMPPHRHEHRYEEISLLAYHLWQKAKCPPGEDLKFWLQAEEQLFGMHEPKSATGQKAPANNKASGSAKTAAKPATKPAASDAGKATGKSQLKSAKQQSRDN